MSRLKALDEMGFGTLDSRFRGNDRFGSTILLGRMSLGELTGWCTGTSMTKPGMVGVIFGRSICSGVQMTECRRGQMTGRSYCKVGRAGGLT